MKTLYILFPIFFFAFMTPLKAQWQLAYNFPEGGGVENLHFVDNNHGWFIGNFTYSGNNYRILRSIDGGFTFSPQVVPSGTYNLYCVFFEDTLNGWIAGGPYNNDGGVILKTTNGGDTWVLISHSAPTGAWSVITKTGNTLLFGGGYDQNGGGGILMKTTNSGTIWSYTQYPISSGGGRITNLVAFDAQN